MSFALPYPDEAAIERAAREDILLVCHQCGGETSRRIDCPACLGTGFIRPCARCFVASHMPQQFTPCLICSGLHYTAGQRPDREDNFYRRPWMTGRGA